MGKIVRRVHANRILQTAPHTIEIKTFYKVFISYGRRKLFAKPIVFSRKIQGTQNKPTVIQNITKKQWFKTSLSTWEGIMDFIPELVKSATVSPTARHRCDVSLELCCPEMGPATCYTLWCNSASMMKIFI